MKAMSTTLVIVVTAIVILVAALVIITIFGKGIGNVATLAEAKNMCETEASVTCKSIGQLPPTWDVPTKTVKTGNGVKQVSCKTLTGMSECSGTSSCIPEGQPCVQGIPCCNGVCDTSTKTCRRDLRVSSI